MSSAQCRVLSATHVLIYALAFLVSFSHGNELSANVGHQATQADRDAASAVEFGVSGSILKATASLPKLQTRSRTIMMRYETDNSEKEVPLSEEASEPDELTESDGAAEQKRLMRRVMRSEDKQADEDPSSEEAGESGSLLETSEGRRRNICGAETWRPWSSCPVTCGPAQHEREQYWDARRRSHLGELGAWAGHGVVGDAGGPCTDRVLKEIATCYGPIRHCPSDCEWSQWTQWSPALCPVPCGTGRQAITRHKLTVQGHGGEHCTDEWLTEQERPCNEQPCPIDCKYRPWLQWTDCTKSCDSGKAVRARVAVDTAEHQGKACDSHFEEGACNTDPCPQDCELKAWSEWGNCTMPCGGGEAMRIKEIILPAMWGGKACSAVEENGTCNAQACAKAGSMQAASPHIFILGAIFMLAISVQEKRQSQALSS